VRLVAILAVLLLGSVGAGVADARPVTPRGRVAQAADPVDVASAAVAKAESARAAIAADRAALQRRYDGELVEIEKLKRQKASWRRDRALRSQLATSNETAKSLTVLAERLKKADADVARARAAAVVAIDRALPRTPVGARRSDLQRKRRMWAPPPPPPKKIRIPDESLDPLADPEELDQQIASLRDTEGALLREVAQLEEQAAKFDHMARLRAQHERADELARRDEADPRRIGTIARGTALDGEGAAAPQDSEDGFGPAPDGIFENDNEPIGDARDFATALSEVVDPSTVDALRRAERSNDPGARAAVARRARDAVNKRLETLRKRRAAIETRARELRTAP
jgi:hypothetical protein